MDIKLKKQKDFDLVYNKGKRLYSKSLTVLVLERNSLKIGISISKKHGKAHVRNRIKRLLRAAMRNYQKSINGNYYIIMMPKTAEDYNYAAFNKDLCYVLKKGGIIND